MMKVRVRIRRILSFRVRVVVRRDVIFPLHVNDPGIELGYGYDWENWLGLES